MERSLSWDQGAIVAVDQRALPRELRLLRLTSVHELVEAISSLAIRGAPAIGVAAALGVALSSALNTTEGVVDEAAVRRDAARLTAARPTAVNLEWGVRRALNRVSEGPRAVLAEALRMLNEDEQTNRAVSRRVAQLVMRLFPERRVRILTHCNTGRLATVAWGTALGAIRELADLDRVHEVLLGETRPLLQGARLTAWELAEAGIPHRLCVDSAGAAALYRGMVDCVLVGADRIAANGDVANKIGTYALAAAARHAGVPFLVASPESSLDAALATGSEIVIEERRSDEVTHFAGMQVAPTGTTVFNPAFDITPTDLVTAVITENNILANGVEVADQPLDPLIGR
ncbi:S-methyl-5-thioribose-1-phosphate isomerase [Frankia sp. AgB32]|uniref:S-methyl-5-thioribose-1-phosphate isomerase n=1 Tax=Frankia sp. AgB32 TaxID=631119 RepID=UPI00200EAF19|nr:S-methyl-5-thioribose-1-phosphate isomerase [Frankia sp. AgB32]MCK9895084.1 S-methyl-5-thioribose-1-phosphate isomerase [Frankia sp. AgB32]